MVDRILAMPEGTRLYLLAPVIRGRKGEYRKDLAELLKRGFTRVKIDGEVYDIDAAPALDKKRKHDIEVVVDRVVVSPTLGTRLADSVETGLNLAHRRAREVAEDADSGERTTFSAKFACPVSGFTIEEIEPRLFSFNNPFGACPSCDGLGIRLYFDAELVVPDQRLSLAQGAVAPWAGSSSPYYRQTLECIAEHYERAHDRALERFAGEGAADHRPRLRERSGSPSPTTTASDNTARPSPSRASCPTWTGAGANPTAPGCATSSASSRAPLRARAAAATG